MLSNSDIVRQFIETVLNRGQIDAAGDFFWEDMVGVSLWDLFSPTNKRCEVDSCVTPQARP